MNHTIHDVGAAARIGRYSDAIETGAALRWLFSSGTPGVLPDGTFPAGIEAQSRLVWKYLSDARKGQHEHGRSGQSYHFLDEC
jgi:enamine deaminase RidA (YjgF/YER057c/UK114 family)